MDQLKLACQRLNSGGCRPVDQGRPGWLASGLQEGGPADRATVMHLNSLLGQAAFTPCLEFTLDAGHWRLRGRGQMALGGADMQWRINNQPVELYSTIELDGDYLLQGKRALRGARSYLAVRGEWIGLPQVWGSCSPGAPGIRPCQLGDTYQIKSKGPTATSSDLDINQHLPELPLRVPVYTGPEFGALPLKQRRALFDQQWTVSPASNRQGLRLVAKGASPVNAAVIDKTQARWSISGYGVGQYIDQQYSIQSSLISSPVLPGTVQLTPSGPILLFRDAQTVGGYPRALVAATDSLNLIGQLLPGDDIYFDWAEN